MSEDDLRRAVAALIAESEDRMWNAFTECGARISLVTFLVENMYANAYISDPDSFGALMDQVQHLNRTSPRPTGPSDPDDLLEFQAQYATFAERFRASVLSRIESELGCLEGGAGKE